MKYAQYDLVASQCLEVMKKLAARDGHQPSRAARCYFELALLYLEWHHLFRQPREFEVIFDIVIDRLDGADIYRY